MSDFIIETPEIDEAVARLRKATQLEARIHAVGGLNQTMAMEANRIVPGFISKVNPIGSFTVMPSQANMRLALEEIDKVKAGIFAAIAAALLALVTKFIFWFRKRRQENGGGIGKDGDSSSSSPLYSGDKAKEVSYGIINIVPDFNKYLEDFARKAGAGYAESKALEEKLNEKVYDRLKESSKKITEAVAELSDNGSNISDLRTLLINHALKHVGNVNKRIETIRNTVKKYSEAEDAGDPEIDSLRASIEEIPCSWYGENEDLDNFNATSLTASQVKAGELAATSIRQRTSLASLSGSEKEIIRKILTGKAIQNYMDFDKAMDTIDTGFKSIQNELEDLNKEVSRNREKGNSADLQVIISRMRLDITSLIQLSTSVTNYNLAYSKYLLESARNYYNAARDCASIARTAKDQDAVKKFNDFADTFRKLHRDK